MVIVDNALGAREAQGRPIRVGMIGAGFMARGLANQILHSAHGMRLVAIFNRAVERAREVYAYAGAPEPAEASTQDALEDAIRAGRPVVTGDAMLLCRSTEIDILVD